MNKNIFFVIMTFSFFSALAQEEDTARMRDPRAREKIRAVHAAYITERLKLTSAEAEKFWPVYREYGEKRREVRQELRDARWKGADDKSLLDLDLKIKQQEVDLEKEYSELLQNIISPEKVLKLRQAEADFRKLLLRQIQQRRRRN